MLEKGINIKTGEGQINTFIVHPDEDGPHPVILFLMDAPGKREELHQMARRIASCGYWVMLPNLYYRRVTEFVSDGTCLLYTSPSPRDATLARMPSSA